MNRESQESPSSVFRVDGGVEWGYNDYQELKVHGRYRLGTVSGYGRRWFVKSIAEDCTDISACRLSLIKEYEIMLSLRRGPVVDVVSLCDIEGVGLSIVMEYVDGEHLDQYLEKASRGKRRDVLRRLIEAVAFIHSRGVVHLDLKPENILVTGSFAHPEICLIDFNLSDSAVFSYNKEVGGNMEFAAPEQFVEGYEADARADVWSLGKILKKYGRGCGWQVVIGRALREDVARRPVDASALLSIEHRQRRVLKISLAAVVMMAVISAGMIWMSTRTMQQPVEVERSDSAVSALVADTVEEASARHEVEKGAESMLGVSPVSEPQKFTAELKEYDRVMAEVKRDMQECLNEIPDWKGDPNKTAGQRIGDFSIWLHNKGFKEPAEKLKMIRDKFPDELLAQHPAEWCKINDRQLLPIRDQINEAVRLKSEELNRELREEIEARRNNNNKESN